MSSDMMSSVLVPIDIPTLSQPLDKLPEDIKKNIITHTNLFKEKAIIPLLESSYADFEIRFEEAAKHFLNYQYQMFILLNSRRSPNNKNDPDISNSLLTESFYSGLDFLRNQLLSGGSNSISSSNNAIVLSILNAIDAIPNYSKLADDPKSRVDVMTRPEYYPALEAYFNIWVCIFALMTVIISDNISYKQKTRSLIQKCQYYTNELEDYTATIEIETDPEQSMILERVKEK